MVEFIGVYSARGFNPSSLKREALLFDRIAIDRLEDYLLELTGGPYPSYHEAAELESLQKENIVFDPKTDLDSIAQQSDDVKNMLSKALSLEQYQTSLINGLPTYIHHDDGTVEFIDSDKSITREDALEIININSGLNSILARITCIGLNFQNDYEACSISKTPEKLNTSGIIVKPSNVLQLVLNKLPTPDEVTPWEKIIEFRNDSNNKGRLVLLRNWIYSVCHREMNEKEANAELESLLYEYEQSLKIYEIKYSFGVLETFITLTADIIENFIKFKFGDVARALFNIKRRKVDLLEAEIHAPGRMISHITYTSKEFSR